MSATAKILRHEIHNPTPAEPARSKRASLEQLLALAAELARRVGRKLELAEGRAKRWRDLDRGLSRLYAAMFVEHVVAGSKRPGVVLELEAFRDRLERLEEIVEKRGAA
jgi:hypothetical protein